MLIYFVSRQLPSISRSSSWLGESTIIHLALIILAGFLAYSNTFDVPFIFDDNHNIVENPLIRDISNFTRPTESDRGVYLETAAVGWKSRKLGYLTFALNYWVNGLDVRGYHAVNLAIHIINALVLYLLVTLTFGTPFMKKSGLAYNARRIALFSALLFVAHPLQSQAVTYIVQRFASLATLFCLVSLALYVRCRMSSAVTPRAALLYAMSLLSAALAMKTKEIAFTLPLMIALYEFLFFDAPLKKKIALLLPIMLTMLIIPLSLIGGDEQAGDVIGGIDEATRLQAKISRPAYLLTEFRVMATYLRLFFLPVNQNFDYDYPAFNSFLNPEVLQSFTLLLTIFGVVIYLVNASRHRDAALRLAAFGIFWFFITISVESSLIPIVDLIYEHRVYLPAAGAMVSVVVVLFLAERKLGERLKRADIILTAFLVVWVAVLAFGTHARNNVWMSEMTFWQDNVSKSPGKARPHNNLGYAYYRNIQADKALEQFATAINLDPNYVLPYNNMGVVYEARGQTDKRIAAYLKALSVAPNFTQSHVNLGSAYLDNGQPDNAILHLEIALKLEPINAKAHALISQAYEQVGLQELAARHRRLAEVSR